MQELALAMRAGPPLVSGTMEHRSQRAGARLIGLLAAITMLSQFYRVSGGVIAPETANNAVTGGAMIPLLSLGIPGDPATAIILGGLMIHGLAPSRMLPPASVSTRAYVT